MCPNPLISLAILSDVKINSHVDPLPVKDPRLMTTCSIKKILARIINGSDIMIWLRLLDDRASLRNHYAVSLNQLI